MKQLHGELKGITPENIKDVICCPGGSEVKGGDFRGDISTSLEWRKEMLKSGFEGFILYQDGKPTGFVEYMPIENASYPVKGEDLAFVMCFHWKSPKKEEKNEHLDVEWKMLKIVIEKMKKDFKGAAALAWDHPVHFPIEMFEDFGFTEVSSEDHISLMWKPFIGSAEKPSLLGPNFEPRDLSDDGKVAVDVGFSHRCPYSIYHHQKVKRAVKELDKDDIELNIHEIDTREEAVKYSISPWNWDWIFANGEKVPVHRLKIEEIKDIFREKITQK